MRIAGCLLALLVLATEVVTQETIGWSLARRLTSYDFKGGVPANAPSASMSWIHIETEWECKDGVLVASARAMFDPARSWFVRSRRSMQVDAQLLDHEQLHFDIAEVAVRTIRARFQDFKDACLEAGGTEPIEHMIAEADRALQNEQDRYDRETRHGIDARMQDRWQRRIRALLK